MENELMSDGDMDSSADFDKQMIAMACMMQAVVAKISELDEKLEATGMVSVKLADYLEVKIPAYARSMMEEQEKTKKAGKTAELRATYPEFSEFEEPFESDKKAGGSSEPPIYEQIYDILEDLKLDAGWSPDAEKEHISKLMGQLKTQYPKPEAAPEPEAAHGGKDKRTPMDHDTDIRKQLETFETARKKRGIKDDKYY